MTRGCPLERTCAQTGLIVRLGMRNKGAGLDALARRHALDPPWLAALMTLRIHPDPLSFTCALGRRGLPQVAETNTPRPMDVAGERLQ
jgi:hypothetical protein